MSYRYERRGAALIIWNANPARRNALTPAYYEGLLAGLEKAATDPNIRAVILAGEGGFFCAGGDLTALRERRNMSLTQRKEQIERLHDITRALRNCPKPVIAAVEGGAAGAGFSIALACDIIVAADNATFTLSYVKAGLVPDGGATHALSQALPRATVAQLALLAEPLPASRALALGLITTLCAPGAAQAEAEALAARIAQGPQTAIASIKSLITQGEANDLPAQLNAERDAMAAALGGDEAQEGMRAFLEKRSPNFGKTQQEEPS